MRRSSASSRSATRDRYRSPLLTVHVDRLTTHRSGVRALAKRMTVDPDEGRSLPAWTYRDPQFFDLEMARVMRPSWQIVCHTSDVAKPGDWQALEFLNESIVV